MSFDGSITLGNILTIIAIAISGVGFVWAIKVEVTVLASRIDKIEAGMANLTAALVQLAKQEARLDAHAERINRLENERRD